MEMFKHQTLTMIYIFKRLMFQCHFNVFYFLTHKIMLFIHKIIEQTCVKIFTLHNLSEPNEFSFIYTAEPH